MRSSSRMPKADRPKISLSSFLGPAGRNIDDLSRVKIVHSRIDELQSVTVSTKLSRQTTDIVVAAGKSVTPRVSVVAARNRSEGRGLTSLWQCLRTLARDSADSV